MGLGSEMGPASETLPSNSASETSSVSEAQAARDRAAAKRRRRVMGEGGWSWTIRYAGTTARHWRATSASADRLARLSAVTLAKPWGSDG